MMERAEQGFFMRISKSSSLRRSLDLDEPLLPQRRPSKKVMFTKTLIIIEDATETGIGLTVHSGVSTPKNIPEKVTDTCGSYCWDVRPSIEIGTWHRYPAHISSGLNEKSTAAPASRRVRHREKCLRVESLIVSSQQLRPKRYSGNSIKGYPTRQLPAYTAKFTIPSRPREPASTEHFSSNAEHHWRTPPLPPPHREAITAGTSDFEEAYPEPHINHPRFTPYHTSRPPTSIPKGPSTDKERQHRDLTPPFTHDGKCFNSLSEKLEYLMAYPRNEPWYAEARQEFSRNARNNRKYTPPEIRMSPEYEPAGPPVKRRKAPEAEERGGQREFVRCNSPVHASEGIKIRGHYAVRDRQRWH
jgi:hypothetical protein